MFNNGMMMDPELLRLAQEQMSRIPPQELAKMQQQMMSNPELLKLASESMKNMRPEDVKRAAEQLKYTRPEDMADMSEKVAKAKPEEIAAMKAHADAQMSYQMSAAQRLKQEGNKLHSGGQYHEAASKYLLAKNNLKDIPTADGGTLQLQCSLNLMSCYLITGQYDDCVKEGSEVLAYDSKNVKALYRRGQAYKELGNLEDAVSDLRKAHEFSPEDETVAGVYRDTNEKLMKSGVPRRVIIEEMEEEGDGPIQAEKCGSSTAAYSVSEPPEAGESSEAGGPQRGVSTGDAECLRNLRDNPETMMAFQNYISNANPDTLAAMGAGGMSPDMVKTATEMIKKMKPEELQKMLDAASSLNGNVPKFPVTPDVTGNGPRFGAQIPEMTPEMIKMASDRMSKMSPEELQKMVEMASSMKVNGTASQEAATDGNSQRSESRMRPGSQFPGMTPEMIQMASDRMKNMSAEEIQKMFELASSMNLNGSPLPNSSEYITRGSENSSQSLSTGRMTTTDAGESSSGRSFPNLVNDQASCSPASSTDLQENLRNSMKDPAMRQMMTSMMKNISPEMMANMSEQYGMKLSKEDAEKVQQTMSSLSPEDLDKMMRWADRAQRGMETVKKTKNWLLGRPGLILAVVMLILAFIFHRLGFIG